MVVPWGGAPYVRTRGSPGSGAGLVVLQGLGQPGLDLLDPGGVGRVRGEELGGLLRAAVRQKNAYRRAGAKRRRCQLHARRVLLRVADLERGEASLHRELLAHPFAAVTRDRVRDL